MPDTIETMRAFNRVMLEGNELYRDAARALNLSENPFWILYSLRDCGGAITQSELVRRMGSSKQTVNSALKTLLRDGLIVLEEGRRAKPVSLTEKGEALCAASVDIVRAQEEGALMALTPEEQAQMIALFDRWTQALRAHLAEKGLTSAQSARKEGTNTP